MMRKPGHAAAIHVEKMSFAFEENELLFNDLSFNLPYFSCCLLLGANGVGKTSLLRLLAGKHMIKQGKVAVLGEDPFSGRLTHHDLMLVGERFPLDLDIPVSDLIENNFMRAKSPGLVRELIGILGVDLKWRMHRVSNGQRRRVDLLLSLMGLPQLVLLDEVSSDLDVVCRQNLLKWLKTQSRSKVMTILFATHILDGMHTWATHLLFLSPQKLRWFGKLSALPLKSDIQSLCMKWMKSER
jgi:CCR4-NOT complex subunit CAF16